MPAKFFAATSPCRPPTLHRKPRFPVSPAIRSSRWTRSPTFASKRTPFLPIPSRPCSSLTPLRCPTTTPPRYSWLKNSALTHPPYLNKDLTSSAASSPWTTRRSPPCYHSTAESPRRLDLTAAPFWTRARLNSSSIKEPLTKWSPWVPLTRLASDPPHPELGAGSDPDSCSARTNRPQ